MVQINFFYLVSLCCVLDTKVKCMGERKRNKLESSPLQRSVAMDFPQLHPSSGQAPHMCKSSVTLRANLSLPLREKDLDRVGPTGDQVPESFYTEGRGRLTPGSPSSPDPILKPFSAPAHTCLLTALVPKLASFGQKGPHDCLKVRPAVSTWEPS